MKRRQFLGIGLCALTALALLPSALAREAGTQVRIGWLSFGSMESHGPYVEAFRQGMSELGYVEGKDYVIDFQWVADGNLLTRAANDMTREQPDVVVATCKYTSAPR